MSGRHEVWRGVALATIVTLTGCTGKPVVHGLRPIEPELGSLIEPAEVDTLRPTFRWSRIRGPVGYDLVISRPIELGGTLAPDVGDGLDRDPSVVYYRENLAEPRHEIEIDLEPGTVYMWAVRTRRGLPEIVSPWSSYDARYELTDREKAANLQAAAEHLPVVLAIGIATMGHTNSIPAPNYITGEAVELEYHPFTFGTPGTRAAD